MTDIFLTNTLSRQKEKFEPLDPAHVRMYVCGPTVYDFAHIGNARPVVVFDTLYRLLKRHYPKVTYARNITDVDDKIMARSKETGEPIDVLTTRTAKAFHDDMGALNALLPDIEPRATAYIAQMISFIETLIEKKHAYVAAGHVLYDVPSLPNYGCLSRRSRDELVAGARVEVAPYKKDPADFVLWKPSSMEQVGWESPWGRGRPGWHIECSAMSKELLGTTFDIHGGGLDLIFPHHENEIAQSCGAHDGAQPARYWVHNGFLTITGDKMSKSLGNFLTVHGLLQQFPGEALRLILLSAQYRQPLDFTGAGVQQAKATLDRWYGALRGVDLSGETDSAIRADFEEALCDDMNTPAAIAILHEMANDVNKASNGAAKKKAAWVLRAAGCAMGLLMQEPEAWFKGGSLDGLGEADIEAAIVARAAAKKAKDFAEADRIRKELADKGVMLEDGASGTTWKRL